MHVAPSATASGALEVYGAPPLSVVPSEQLRLQPTSSGHEPLEQVTVEITVVGVGGGIGGNGGNGGNGGWGESSLTTHCCPAAEAEVQAAMAADSE